jgi:glycosyltransferase involved in cell wall biosynthesis
LLEAMALGLPVVVTKVGGVPSVVRENLEGVLVPPERPDLMADAFAALARDVAWRTRLGAAAAARAADYDIAVAARRIESIYAGLTPLASRP